MVEIHKFKIDSDHPDPLYVQIKHNLLELIKTNTLTSNEMLPSERVLSDAYEVNRMTVRQAINELTLQGLLTRKHGVGTFVTDEKLLPPFSPTIEGFTERLIADGHHPTSKVITQKKIVADEYIAQSLSVEVGEAIVCLERLRLVNNMPVMIEKSYLPYAPYPLLLETDFNQQSLYNFLLNQYQVKIHETEHALEPTLLTKEESELLTIDIHRPAILVYIKAYAKDHKTVEFCKSLIRGDQCRFYFKTTNLGEMKR